MSAESEPKSFRWATESQQLTEDHDSLARGSCRVGLSPHLLQLLGVGPGDVVTFTLRDDGVITVEGKRKITTSIEHHPAVQDIPFDADQLPLFDTTQDGLKHQHHKE